MSKIFGKPFVSPKINILLSMRANISLTTPVWPQYQQYVHDEAQNFFKNLGIFAGLLLLAAVNIEDSKSS